MKLKIFGGILGAVLALSVAQAEPPGGTQSNSLLSRWYRTLTIPDDPEKRGCCDDSDCRPVEVRFENGRWEAFLERRNHPGAPIVGVWIAIPERRIIHDKTHPAGSAVMCWINISGSNVDLSGEIGVLCFVPPSSGG
jgi:hypothetical protein